MNTNEPVPKDRLRIRLIGNRVRMIREHLEAMQRDAHGLEYAPWKAEVDEIWKDVFQDVNELEPELQPAVLESVRELWMTYITHYGVGLN